MNIFLVIYYQNKTVFKCLLKLVSDSNKRFENFYSYYIHFARGNTKMHVVHNQAQKDYILLKVSCKMHLYGL